VRGTRHVSAWWIFATGVLWLGIGGALGLGALAVALLPGSLITAGGVRLLLASDVRSPQLAALGSALGVLAAPLVVWAAGGGWAIGALLASAASFVAVGWTALALEPELEEVPTPAPTPGYAAKAALDDTLMSLMTLSHRPPDRSQLRHNAEELLRCHELFARRGWLEKPEDFHRTPPPFEAPEIERARTRGLDYEHLRFDSGYEPDPEWLAFEANRTAHAFVCRHPGPPRPWLVNIHGFGTGEARTDLPAFRAGWLHTQLGINLAHYVLPVHGPRAPGRRSGLEFMNTPAHLLHAEGQAIWELRRLIAWLRTQEAAPAVGVSGLSLGGYTVGVLAGIEDGLACAIAGVPPSDFVHTTRRFGSSLELGLAESVGHDWDVQRAVERVISPLAFAPRLDRERRFIYAATGDRFVPAAQVRELWRHWEKPRTLWSATGHVWVVLERDARNFIADALRATLT
jgi:hypothetical protein